MGQGHVKKTRNKTHLPLRRFQLRLLRHPGLFLLLNHPQQRITPPLQLLRRPTLEKPIKPEHRELRDILLDPLIHIVRLHPIVIESAQEVPILFFRVHFALGRGIVQLQLLHRVPNRCDLLLEKHLEVFTFVALRFAFFDTCFDAGVF